MILRRVYSAGWGVFGHLCTDDGNRFCWTLEHAYPDTSDATKFHAKIPVGTYYCMRGMHQLAGAKEPFETFEIIGVPGHSGLLFHPGNTNRDSEGCVLLGDKIQNYMLLDSRNTFERFMKLKAGTNNFKLEVIDDSSTAYVLC